MSSSLAVETSLTQSSPVSAMTTLVTRADTVVAVAEGIGDDHIGDMYQ